MKPKGILKAEPKADAKRFCCGAATVRLMSAGQLIPPKQIILICDIEGIGGLENRWKGGHGVEYKSVTSPALGIQ
jgi:hypothetical protein